MRSGAQARNDVPFDSALRRRPQSSYKRHWVSASTGENSSENQTMDILSAALQFLRLSLLLVVSTSCFTNIANSQENSAVPALARLRGLAGEWEGTFEWTGSRTGSGNMNATYYVTGNNSAVVENLTMGGAPTMTSVYHLDGDALRMTHYCGAGNQPRLKADRIDLGKGIVNFAFVDATNLATPDAPHVHGMELRFVDNNHITVTFLFLSGSKESRERIALTRVKTSAAQG